MHWYDLTLLMFQKSMQNSPSFYTLIYNFIGNNRIFSVLPISKKTKINLATPCVVLLGFLLASQYAQKFVEGKPES